MIGGHRALQNDTALDAREQRKVVLKSLDRSGVEARLLRGCVRERSEFRSASGDMVGPWNADASNLDRLPIEVNCCGRRCYLSGSKVGADAHFRWHFSGDVPAVRRETGHQFFPFLRLAAFILQASLQYTRCRPLCRRSLSGSGPPHSLHWVGVKTSYHYRNNVRRWPSLPSLPTLQIRSQCVARHLCPPLRPALIRVGCRIHIDWAWCHRSVQCRPTRCKGRAPRQHQCEKKAEAHALRYALAPNYCQGYSLRNTGRGNAERMAMAVTLSDGALFFQARKNKRDGFRIGAGAVTTETAGPSRREQSVEARGYLNVIAG